MATKLLKYGLGVYTPVGQYPTAEHGAAQKMKVNSPGGVFVTARDKPKRLDWHHLDELYCQANVERWREVFPDWTDETLFDSAAIGIPEGFVSPVPVWLELGTASHVTILVGKGAKITIEEDRFVSGHGAAIVSLWIHEGAEVTYLSKRLATRKEDEHLIRDVWIDGGASLRLREAYLSGGLFRSHTRVCLAGENAQVDIRNVFFGEQDMLLDLSHEIKHFRPKTHSKLASRGVLKDRSRAIARSLIRIEKEAHRSVASQNLQALSLSDKVTVDAIPTLEIENQNVACGHSAAVSRPDEEKLFYMMSRGLDRESALREYVGGFLEAGVGSEFDYRSYAVKTAIDEKLSRHETV